MDIKELTRTLIQTEITKALSEAPEAINALVQAALAQEVDENGNKPDYHSKHKMPWLEWKVGQLIRTAATGAIQDAVKAKEDEIRALVSEKINSLVDALVEITFADEEQ